MDRISRLIKQQRLLQFPEGKGLAGVMFEWRMRHQNPKTAYIQRIYDDTNSVIIICFLKKQAQLFHSQTTFEVDMSFKRIQEKGINEIIFAIWLEEHGKIFTLAQVITNSERMRNYQLYFHRVFELLSERVQKLFQ